MSILLQIREILNNSTLALATTGADGEPHAVAVFFAADDELDLYFFSATSSQHSQDLGRDPRAAVSLYPETRAWQEIRGLQMRGSVHLVEPGTAWDRAWQLYLAKFPFAAEMSAQVSRTRLYVFRPDWIRLVDNRQGFGFKQEWVREQTSAGGPAGWGLLDAGEAGA